MLQLSTMAAAEYAVAHSFSAVPQQYEITTHMLAGDRGNTHHLA